MSTESQLSLLIFFFNHKMINYVKFQQNNLLKQLSSFHFCGRLRRKTLDKQRTVCNIVFIVFRELTIFLAKLSFHLGFVVVHEWCVACWTMKRMHSTWNIFVIPLVYVAEVIPKFELSTVTTMWEMKHGREFSGQTV